MLPRLPLLTALALTLACAAPASAAWSLTPAEGDPVKEISINQWSTKEGLSYTNAAGKLAKLPTRDVVSLNNDRPNNPANADWTLRLRNGDLLRGQPASMKDNNVQFRVENVGTVDVPLRYFATLASKDAPAADKAPPDQDVVELKNSGDTLAGMFLDLNDEGITLQSDLGETKLAWSRIDRLSLGGAVPPRTLPPLSFRLTFTGGSTLTVPADGFSWNIATVTFKDPAGNERKIDADQVTSIDVLGGRVLPLTAIDPASETHTPTFTVKHPARINTNVMGGPLKIKDHTYPKGIGVHTASTLTYELDGTFDTLLLRVGMDDSAAPHGRANVTILLDGKTLWETKNLAPGKITEQLQLPIKNGKKLELQATPADRLDVLGRVNYIAPTLRRP